MFTILVLLPVTILGSLQIFFFARSFLHIHFLYPKIYLPTFASPASFPSVRLFVPLKGRGSRIEKVLEAFATQEYPGTYAVSLLTESKDDPASPVAAEIAKRFSHVSHIVAGYAKTCSQKNHNLLAGIEHDRKSEVYVFVDSDVLVDAHWLRMLVRPLTTGKTMITTGMSSGAITQATGPQIMEAALTTFQAKLVIGITAVWGGTCGIWRETFEAIGAEARWKETVVDDITLFQQVERYNERVSRAERLRVLSVPDLQTDIPTRMPSWGALATWLTRQVDFLKYYRYPIWLLSVGGYFFQGAVNLAALPLLFLGSYYDSPDMKQAGIIAIGFYLFMGLINFSQIVIRKKTECSTLRWLQICMIGDVFANYSLQRSVFTKDIYWGKILYKLDRQGLVKEVIHPHHNPQGADAQAFLRPE